MIATLIWMLAVASVPPVYTTSQLDEGILCVLALGKLDNGDVFVRPTKVGNAIMTGFGSRQNPHTP